MSTPRKIPINNYETGRADPQATTDEAARAAAGTGAAAAEGPGAGAASAPGAAPRSAATVGDASAPPLSGADAAAEAMEKLLAEREELNDALLRLRAEFDNYRKRSVRELIESRERAQGELLHDLLPVLDNLERALDAAEHHDEGKVLGGVRMTRDLFVDLLKRAGVEEIETAEVAFDPEVHEAILTQPSTVDEGICVAELQRGYRQGDRVLRPARVVVSSGPADTSSGKA